MPSSPLQKFDRLDDDAILSIARRRYAFQKYAYICVDEDWRVIDSSENLGIYGLEPLDSRVDVRDQIDFLVGVDASLDLELPMLSSPTELPIRVSVLPCEGYLLLIIVSAQEEFEQRKQLQQKANENQLLLDQQIKLMARLETAEKRLTKQNKELQEAARIQNDFLSGVSHEFRTPLTSILGYTNLLAKSVLDETAAGYLSSVRRSGNHLLSLIENLLDHGKLDANQINLNPKINSLTEIFNDVELLFKPLAQTKSIDFETITKFPTNLSVVLDDSRLRQSLINLVGNAIKYTDVGTVKLIADWQDDTLKVEIADTGIGIHSKDLQKIKLPFWQVPNTGKVGTGLGLTITEQVIEMMGGSLTIESTQGVGTTVNFDIIVPALDSTLEASNSSLPLPSKSLKILLAEDDPDIGLLVKVMLEGRGISVCRVENGALAVGRLKEEQFDLVLMDLHMPLLGGYGAVESIRSSGNEVPIVMMTASSTESDQSKAELLGCDGYLVKPVSIDDLLSMADQLVGD